jgi:glutathione-regulated potassium-efflux system ancillary protein KefG
VDVVALDDLIDVTGVARLVGLAHRNSVTTYLRRYRDFPRPVLETPSRHCRLWSRSDVLTWVGAREMTARRRGSAR